MAIRETRRCLTVNEDLVYLQKKLYMANKISVVINTYNGEEHLAEVLESFKGFDEVVVCDMECTDCTVRIAERYGCKVVTFPKGDVTICEPARNMAIRSASNSWVLVMDDDEMATPELVAYLYERISSADCPVALSIPRINRFLGRFNYHSPEHLIRFFQRDKADWPPTIHSIVNIDGRVERVPGNLKGVHILHLADSSMSQIIEKTNRYTDRELLRRNKKKWDAGTLLVRPAWFFFRFYVVKKGFLNGRRGLIEAYMKAFYQTVLISKLMEKRWNDEPDNR